MDSIGLNRIDAQPGVVDLKAPELYLNQELSLLEFQERVLAQGSDERLPLLERLRFLCITSTNLDEFFEIRVAGLKQQIALGSTQSWPDSGKPQEALKSIRERVHRLVADQYRLLNDVLMPELSRQGIRFVRRAEWNEKQDAWIRKYFKEELLPVLSPLGLDPAHPFPRILNKSLNFIVWLKGKDAFGRKGGLAIVQAPRALPRVIQLPPEADGRCDFVFLSSVMHAYVEELFPGMKVEGCYQFRLTRNSDLFVEEEEIDDLLRAVEGELLSRRYGDEVRLEVTDDCPDYLLSYLLDQFGLTREDLYQVNGPVNLNRLSAIYDLVDRPDLKFPGFNPTIPAPLGRDVDLFEVVRGTDVLLHHPFESFAPVIEFLRQASLDPAVLAIKQTLYRTESNSAMVDALVAAARAGKEVTIVIELRARFDEAANIALANRLQEAGAHVVYGVVGYKTHAKMLLIVRREASALRYYVHLGTGNYHSKTARAYTDYGLFTSDHAVGEDVHKIFLQLTSLGKVSQLNKLAQSPFTLYTMLIEKIEREIRNAQSGTTARIIVKVNSLVEPQLIQALYRASMAGVKVDLIVRGMCRLRPQIPGISEHITVRSIVGRFLEHARVFCFHNGGDPDVLLSSADFRERNLFRRVEICFPVESRKQRKRVIQDLELYLRDQSQAWELTSSGHWKRLEPAAGEEPCSAQTNLLRELTSGG